ncbi:unnamed protein product [Sphagnum troendelagicum]
MVATVTVRYRSQVDDQTVFDHLIGILSREYDMERIHKCCNVVNFVRANGPDSEDEEGDEDDHSLDGQGGKGLAKDRKLMKQFIFPFIDSLGESFWNRMSKESNSTIEVLEETPMEREVPVHHFNEYNGKYEKLVLKIKNKPLIEIKEKMNAYCDKWKFEIASSKFDSGVATITEESRQNSLIDNEMQHYFAGILRHVDIDKFDKKFCGMMRYLFSDSECDFRCLSVVSAAKSELVSNAKPVPCSMMQFDCLACDKIKEGMPAANGDDYVYLVKTKMVEDQIRAACEKYEPNHIANIFVVFYRSSMVYCSQSSKMYYYKQHVHGWETMDDNKLYNFIDVNFRNLMSRVASIKDSDIARKLKDISQNMVKKPSFARRLAEIVKYKMIDNSFYDLADSTPVLRLKDTVVEILPGSVKVRPGKPDDYCTKSGDANFFYDSDMKKEEIDQLEKKTMEVLRQVFPIPEILEYFMLFLCSALTYGNFEKFLTLFLGSGNNGKTLIIKVFAYVMGSYYNAPSVSQLREDKRDSGSASEDMVDNHRARILFYIEPNTNRDPNQNILKSYTGGDDSFKGRRIFEHSRKLYINCNIVICANFLFKLGIIDAALSSRVNVIPFVSLFVDAEDVPKKRKKNPYVYEKVKSYMDDYKQFATPLIRLLVNEYLPKYHKHGLVPNEHIIKATNDFKFRGDPIARFMHECTKATDKPKKKVTTNELYERYKSWSNLFVSGKKSQDKDSFDNYLHAKDYIMDEEYVYGIVLKDDRDRTSASTSKSRHKIVADTEEEDL